MTLFEGKPVEAVFAEDEAAVVVFEYSVPLTLWLGRLVPCEACELDMIEAEVLF